MSDPFDRLRAGSDGSAEPPLDAIKARARRIERRRYAALGGGAVAIALVAIGITLSAGPTDKGAERLAQPALDEATPGAAAESPSRGSVQKLQRAPESPFGAAGTVASPPAEASMAESGDAPAAAAPRAESDQAAEGLEVTLEVDDQSLGPRRGAGLTLRACNRSGQTVKRTFSSSQRYDFEVSRDGELVWRWSDEKAFTQVIGEESWGPGQCKTYSEWWEGTDSSGAPAASGTYQAVGVLTSSPPMRTPSQDFCLDVC